MQRMRDLISDGSNPGAVLAHDIARLKRNRSGRFRTTPSLGNSHVVGFRADGAEAFVRGRGARRGSGRQRGAQLLDNGQLDQLVAPIALYPDALVAQVLMASTYPLEIVQADRWAKINKTLKGDKLDDALTKQDWDDSVKALVATPTVLAMMNEDLDWTEKLGDAVLAQQADVMDAIQRLSHPGSGERKARHHQQQTVTVTQEADKPMIVIAPTSPEIVYVPYYEPAVVYGAWPYPAYPPYYFPPAPGYVVGGALARGIAWGAASPSAMPSGTITSIGVTATFTSISTRT